MATASSDGCLRVWHLHQQHSLEEQAVAQQIVQLQIPNRQVHCVVFAPGSRGRVTLAAAV